LPYALKATPRWLIEHADIIVFILLVALKATPRWLIEIADKYSIGSKSRPIEEKRKEKKMSIIEMASMIGTTIQVKDSSRGTSYPALVKDVKIVWGATRVLVSPVGGSGEAWVQI